MYIYIYLEKGGIKKKEKATSIEVSAELLIGTIKNGESDQFVEYLNLGHNINCYDKDHLTPLHHALLTRNIYIRNIYIYKYIFKYFEDRIILLTTINKI